MAELLVLRDFRVADHLDAARMFYEGGASFCGYYHTYGVEVERDSRPEAENVVSVYFYETA